MIDAVNKMRHWREHPADMVRDLFQAEPDTWQEEVLRAFPLNNRIAMKACKGPGKSTVLAWMIWNFMLTRPYPKIAVTSITQPNLMDNLWTELSKWYGRSELLKSLFDVQKTRITAKEAPDTWWCSARAWPKQADAMQQADTLAGLHADYVMVVLDESGGIPEAVMASAEAALATGVEMKIVQAGNPTHLSGPLYRACHDERHLWYVVEITGDPENPKRASRINKQWAQEQIDKYGRENPWVMVNVFGKFPPSSMNTLLSADEVSEAMSRHLNEDDYSFSQKRLGVDVARFGDDSTIIFPRQGLAAFPPSEMRNARTQEIAGKIMQLKYEVDSELELIDATGGYGAGVEDALLQAGVDCMPISFAGKADDPRYYNKRSEMWFRMADWVKGGGALPKDPQLLRELTAPTYTFHQGKMRLEDKEQIKQRLGSSPDMADALALTFAIPDMPKSSVAEKGTGKATYDYDPINDERD